MIENAKINKIYTNIPSLASELIDVVKLFVREGQFEFCEDMQQADVKHLFLQTDDEIINTV